MGLPTIDGKIVQCLGQAESVTRAFSSTTANVQLATDWKIVEVWCDQDCYIKWGNSGIEADTTTSRPLTAKIPVIIAVPVSGAYIAALRQSVDGTLWITNLS